MTTYLLAYGIVMGITGATLSFYGSIQLFQSAKTFIYKDDIKKDLEHFILFVVAGIEKPINSITVPIVLPSWQIVPKPITQPTKGVLTRAPTFTTRPQKGVLTRAPVTKSYTKKCKTPVLGRYHTICNL